MTHGLTHGMVMVALVWVGLTGAGAHVGLSDLDGAGDLHITDTDGAVLTMALVGDTRITAMAVIGDTIPTTVLGGILIMDTDTIIITMEDQVDALRTLFDLKTATVSTQEQLVPVEEIYHHLRHPDVVLLQ